jgi:hypothetical protein
VQWERAWYGLPWPWVGRAVQVQADAATVQLWAGAQRLVVHPRASRPGQRFAAPGRWDGLRAGDGGPRKEALAAQVPAVEVERRPLAVDAALAGGER